MTADIPQWTLEALDDAKVKQQFIFVSPAGASRVYIIDAQTLWRTNPDIIFQTGYRIAGTPEDITNVLLQQGIDPTNIEELMASAITSNNYAHELAEIYNEETASYNAWRRAVIKANVDAPGVKLFDVMVAINPEILTRVKTDKQAKAMGLTTGLPKKTRGRAIESLFDKIARLPPGKFLDVSKLEPSGTGTHPTDAPTKRSRKYGVPGLPIISSNLDRYLLAIRMLPGGEAQYANEVAQIRELFARLQTGPIITIPGGPTNTVPLITTAPRMPGTTINIPTFPRIPGTVTVPVVQQTPGTTINIPTFPRIPGTVTVPVVQQTPDTTINIPTFPRIPATETVPQVPKIVMPGIPMITTTPIPQTEDYTPTAVYPMYTKAQRNKMKKLKTEADALAQGLPATTKEAILQVPLFPTTTTTIPFPGGIQPDMSPVKIPNPFENVQDLFVEQDEYEEEEDDEEEQDEEEQDEEVDEAEAEFTRGAAIIPTTPAITVPNNVPLMPTIPTVARTPPIIPTVARTPPIVPTAVKTPPIIPQLTTPTQVPTAVKTPPIIPQLTTPTQVPTAVKTPPIIPQLTTPTQVPTAVKTPPIIPQLTTPTQLPPIPIVPGTPIQLPTVARTPPTIPQLTTPTQLPPIPTTPPTVMVPTGAPALMTVAPSPQARPTIPTTPRLATIPIINIGLI